MFRKKYIILTGILLVMISLSGCSEKEIPTTGGKVDNTDYSAPKTIHSRNIAEFNVSFYVECDVPDEELSAWYEFKIAGNILSESQVFKTSAAVSEADLNELQTIIEEYELAKKNGINCYTSGLAPEYRPNSFKAVYDSGEVLSFREDNDPYSLWGKEILYLFKEILTKPEV